MLSTKGTKPENSGTTSKQRGMTKGVSDFRKYLRAFSHVISEQTSLGIRVAFLQLPANYDSIIQ